MKSIFKVSFISNTGSVSIPEDLLISRDGRDERVPNEFQTYPEAEAILVHLKEIGSFQIQKIFQN